VPTHGSGPRWFRYAFLVEDLHPLLPAGLPAHSDQVSTITDDPTNTGFRPCRRPRADLRPRPARSMRKSARSGSRARFWCIESSTPTSPMPPRLSPWTDPVKSVLAKNAGKPPSESAPAPLAPPMLPPHPRSWGKKADSDVADAPVESGDGGHSPTACQIPTQGLQRRADPNAAKADPHPTSRHLRQRRLPET